MVNLKLILINGVQVLGLVIDIPEIDYGKSYDSIAELYPCLSNKLDDFVMPEHFYPWADSRLAFKFPKHCYVHDRKLETIWRDDLKGLDHVVYPKLSIAPDFSIHQDEPLMYAIYQVWRSRSIARYWQEAGVFVIPTIAWARPAINRCLFHGLADCEVVAIRTARKGCEREWVAACREFQQVNSPRLVLQFGTKQGLGVWDCEVINLNVSDRIWKLGNVRN